MMALGSVIGLGHFYGSGLAFAAAGRPAVIVDLLGHDSESRPALYGGGTWALLLGFSYALLKGGEKSVRAFQNRGSEQL